MWSSPCPEASLQRLVGRAGVLEGDAGLVCLWKIDEGAGAFLHNARPLQRLKLARGAKPVTTSCGGTGAEGHAELVGEWEWVPCFDPEYYEGVTDVESSMNSGAAAAAPSAAVDGHIPSVNPPVGPPPPVSATPLVVSGAGGGPVVSPAAGLSTGTDTDFTRSVGGRSVSTVGDEEEHVEDEEEKDDVDDREGNRESVGEERSLRPSSCARTGVRGRAAHAAAAAATAVGAGAALGAGAVLEEATPDGAPREVSAKEALLGVLGKVFQQCSVYLAPFGGDPLLESLPPVSRYRTEARVKHQLQLVRRKERALRAVVQPEVRDGGY